MNQRDDTYSIRTLFFIISVVLLLARPLPTALAQAPPITPSGLNTQVSGPFAVGGQTQFNITGGTRPGGGANLFHSFGNFNVPTNNIANFLNNSGLPTSNILGRVTGGNISNIFGTIQTTGFGNANLFLMNPAGFLFGPTATVNVGGMVAFTTADYMRLADGAKFNALPNAAADALLSAAPVAAFGFLGSNPGAITVQGSQLTVASGTGISLVGGDITVQAGTLTAPSGQINLVSVNKPSNPHAGGEVVVSGSGPSAALVPTGFQSLGTITLSQGSSVDTSAALFTELAGGVSIRGGQFVMDASSITAKSGSGAQGTPGNIEVTANTISLSNQSRIQTGGPHCCSELLPPGNITLNAEIFSATDSTILIEAFGFPPIVHSGMSGAISIQGINGLGSSAKLVTLTNSNVSSVGGEQIAAGPITIHATGVILNQSQLTSFSDELMGGPITIDAGQQIQSVGSMLTTVGRTEAGTIDLRAGARIALTDTGIFASGQPETGAGGNIFLSAPVISVRGGSIKADSRGVFGNGGNIIINAGATFVSQNSTISADAHGRSGDGNGGTIQVQANQVEISNSQFTTSVSGGPTTVGGQITLDGNVVRLQNSQILSTATEGQGGTINITTHRFRPDASSVIDASSQFGTDGTVTIQQSGNNP